MREVVVEEREALGLGATDRLDPYRLAETHGIRIYALSDLRKSGVSDAAFAHFTGEGSGKWSAALVPLGSSRIIIEHDGHAEVRRRASLAHELGHFLLEHEFAAALLDGDHDRQFDKVKEKQANFMAAELLIPEPAARRAAYAKWGNHQVGRAYGVSPQFAQMRMSGVRVMAERAAKKFARR